MDEKQLQLLWESHAKSGGFKDYNEFKSLMLNPSSRKVYFDDANTQLGFKDYGEFETILQVKKKEQSTPSIVSSIGAKIGGEAGTGVVQSSKSLSDVGSSASSTERGLSIAGNTTGEVAPKKRIYDFDANDPYGKIGSQIDEDVQKEKDKPINYTSINNIGRFQGYKDKSIEELEATKEQLKESIFPTAAAARKWAFREGKQLDENNKTDQLAISVLEENKKVKDIISANGGDLQKSAVDYYSENDDQLKVLKEAGQAPPAKVAAELEHKFLQDKNVRELADESQEFRNIYKERADNFYSNHPELRINKIVGQIAQGREDYGYNNPFLNLTGVKSSDKVIENLAMRGEIDRFDQEFYYKNIRPLIAAKAVKIPTTGLIENTFQSAVKGIEDIPKGVYELTGARNLVTSKADRVYDSMEEDADMIGVQPKGINKVSHATGNLAGVLVPITGGAKILQGVNLLKNGARANELMMGITFYHDLQKEAEKTNPNDAWGNHITALVQSAVYMKIAKALPKLSGNIIADSKPAIQDVLAKLRNNEISGAVATKSIADVVVDNAAKVGGETLKMATEMSLAVGINDAVSGIFSGKFDADMTLQNMGHTFESMLLGAPLLQMASIRGGQRTAAADIINGISEKPEVYRAEIQKQAELDPEFAKQAPEMLANLDHVVELRKTLDGMEGLSDKQKKEFILTELQQKVLEDKIKKSPSKILTTSDAKKIEELEVEKKIILDPEISNTNIVKEFYDNELLGKGSMENLSVRDAEGKPTNKFDESKVGDFLKEAAQRLNNLDSEWKPNTVGNSEKAARESYPEAIQEAAEKRWSKEIEASKEPIEGHMKFEEEAVEPETKIEEPTVSETEGAGSSGVVGKSEVGTDAAINNITDLEGKINKHFLKEALVKAPVLLSVNEKSVSESIGHLKKIAKEINDTELNDTVSYLENAANMVFAIKELEGRKVDEFLSDRENFYSEKRPPQEVLKRLEDWSNVLKANTEKGKAERLLREQYQQVLAETQKRFVDEGRTPNRPKQISEGAGAGSSGVEGKSDVVVDKVDDVGGDVVGKTFRDNYNRTFEVKGENAGILTLEDVDTGKVLRKKKSEVLSDFKEITDSEVAINDKIISDAKVVGDAFGLKLGKSYKGDDVYVGEIKNVRLNPKEFSVSEFGQEEKVNEEGAENIDLSEPIEAEVQANGAIKVTDGHHRLWAARKLGKDLNVNLTIPSTKIKEISPLLNEIYQNSKADGTNPELVKAVEQSLSKQESGGKAPVTKPEGKSDVVGNQQKVETKRVEKVAELEAERDMAILREGKPEVKMEFVTAKELVDSKDPIANKKTHDDIKDRYKELRNLLDCLWQKK